MNTRETVFVLLMASAAGCWGIHTAYLNNTERSSQESPQQAQARALQFVTDSRTRIQDTTQGDDTAHITTRIVQAWSNNPFAVHARSKVIASQAPIAIRYSGYLNVEGKQFALLNDLAYQSGDTISGSPYHVRLIQSNQVVLAFAGGHKTVSITIEDESKRRAE